MCNVQSDMQDSDNSSDEEADAGAADVTSERESAPSTPVPVEPPKSRSERLQLLVRVLHQD